MKLKENIPIKPELLAPSGNFESLRAAVINGADAVYLGTREFNARVYARNFSLEELGKAVDYCHNHGVRVYLTLNTLIKNTEVRRFFRVLSRAYESGIDGVIIQHLSFLEIIGHNYPGLKVFMSTQAALGNAASTSLLKLADRIILPRELSLNEIKTIRQSGVNVEVFVHGALCFSYSGLCLFSSFVSNRSGNRGSCAQLCRQRYNNCYPLSTKELCTVKHIPELIKAGVSGFKIEGRMRSTLYVAVATRLYRKAIDSYLEGKFILPEKEIAEIEVVFNREFTEGFICSDPGLISPEKPMNRGAYIGTVIDGQVNLQRTVSVGDGVGLWFDGIVTGAIIKKMISSNRYVNRANTGQKVDLGLNAKDGTKIYLTSSPSIKLEPDFTIKKTPILSPKRNRIEASLPRIGARKGKGIKFLVKAYSLAEAEESLKSGADFVFYNIFADDFPAGISGLGAFIPRIINDVELEIASSLLNIQRPAAILSGNIGVLARRAHMTMPVFLDYSSNAFNDFDLQYFRRYDAVPILSPELTLREMGSLSNKDAVVFIHGDIVLMNTLINPGAERLKDEMGNIFSVRKESNYWQILNCRPFGLFNDIRKVVELGFSQFYVDKQGEGAKYVALYRKLLVNEISDRRLRKGHTSGHLYSPVS